MNKETSATLKKEFFNYERLSDIRFKVEGSEEVIYSHKAVLACRCPFMEAMFHGSFSESTKREIVISDTDYHCLLAFLEFLYTDRLPQMVCTTKFNLLENQKGENFL